MMFSTSRPGHYKFSAIFLAPFLLANQLEVKKSDLVEWHMEGSRPLILAWTKTSQTSVGLWERWEIHHWDFRVVVMVSTSLWTSNFVMGIDVQFVSMDSIARDSAWSWVHTGEHTLGCGRGGVMNTSAIKAELMKLFSLDKMIYYQKHRFGVRFSWVQSAILPLVGQAILSPLWTCFTIYKMGLETSTWYDCFEN